MTTLFGVRHPAVNAAVLVGDRQGTLVDNSNHKLGKKELKRKLYISQDNLYAVGHSGKDDDTTKEFISNLMSGKYDIESAVSSGMFNEFRELNIASMGIKTPDTKNLSYLILMTRFNNDPKLYFCEPLGEVTGTHCAITGTGGPSIVEYMNYLKVKQNLEELRGNSVSREPKIEDLIEASLEAVMRAQSIDPASQGLDMLICTPEKIIDHNLDLKFNFEEKLNEIQKKYFGSCHVFA